MFGVKLRCFDFCSRFHAAFLVLVEEGQNRNYCDDCWNARINGSGPHIPDKEAVSTDSLNLEKDPS